MSVIDELRQLLDEEQSALLSGKYEELADLANRKANLIARFKAQPLENILSGAAALKSQTQRNEELLAAAAKGFRAGLGQVRALGQSAEQSTYARDGRRHILGQHQKSFEQKV